MQTWPLTVLEGPSLALVAPHGVQPVAGVTPEIAALLPRIAAGTEVECTGSGFNIRELIVERIREAHRPGWQAIVSVNAATTCRSRATPR